MERLAVITGASSGVGRAIALRLASPDTAMVLLGRDRERLEATAAEAAARGARARAYAADLTDETAFQAAVGYALKQLHGLDVLIHAAGVIAMGETAHADVSELDTQYETNLRVPYQLTQRLLPCLRARQGQIVFVNSTAGLQAAPNAAAYSATKHGLRAFADALRAEVNTDGVRVISVFLGRTATPMQRRVHAHERRDYRPERLIQPADVADVVVNTLALSPTVEVTEIRLRPARKPTDS
jgi:NADP-dependent 3-hydroxy acid dehydrogenase YdfG